MATIDMTHRKLNFPPRFLPYLEKHRIFELFHECIELLVQTKPEDHVKFLKTILPSAAIKKDKQRIIFLSPKSFDRETFSMLVAECLGIQCISRITMEMLATEKKIEEYPKVEEEVAKVSDEEKAVEISEEESCVCPEGTYEGYDMFWGGEGEDRFSQILYPSEEPYIPESESVESEEEVAQEQPEEPRVCVCPCVNQPNRSELDDEKKQKRRLRRRKKGTGGEDESEWEGEEGGELNGEVGGDPCQEPEKKKKKRKKKLWTSPKGFSMTASSTSPQTDYGVLGGLEFGAKGWILEDFPMTEEEIESLCTAGIIPTHAIRIIIDQEQEMKNWEYKWLVLKWMEAYKYVPVMEIIVGERTVEQLASDLCKILQVMPHRHAPMLPRMVLIGSRGSGVTTQGQKLAKKYGLVHVEFETIISRALQQDDEMAKYYQQQLATRPDPEVEAFILERVLLNAACRNRGWVLTGYPRNVDQTRMLDLLATPPNRVIFIEVPARECFVRLFYRKTDSYLGEEYKLPQIEPFGVETFETPDLDAEITQRFMSHPKNNKKQIIHDISQYFIEKQEMMAYCGKTASYVDGNRSVDSVFELIEQIIINPAPPQPPRDPLSVNNGIKDSYERLRKFRLVSGMFFNNLFLNPPERIIRL